MALINLYTIRILLLRLGVDDFGLLNVILSVVGLSTFVSGSIGMITQRYISYAIGTDDQDSLRRYYDACFAICFCSALIIVFSLETAGVWFLTSELVVAPEREPAAAVLFQFLVVSFVASIFFGFHSWVIMAHEDMHVFAFFSVLNAVLKFCAAFLIGTGSGDGLVTYGFLLAAAGLISMSAQWLFCIRRYRECRRILFRVDRATIVEMLGFTGWTLFGQFTTVCRTQAITILINQGFSPATVAARALSFTVYAQTMTFCQNFSSAINPPIIKSYAARDSERTFGLIVFGSRLVFFLSWMVTLPVIALAPGVFDLWLGTYPTETILFTRLALIEGAITSISFPLMTAVRAVGQMRVYELSLGSMQIMCLVVSWLLVLLGYPASAIFVVSILVSLAMFFVRFALACRLAGLPAIAYVRAVLGPVGMVVIVSSGLAWAILRVNPGAERLAHDASSLAAAALIVLLPVVVIYAFGLSESERKLSRDMVLKRFARMRARI